MKEILLELSESAKSIVENKEYTDIDLCKMAVLFPFIEALGYDTTVVGDVKIAPVYTPDASYKIDYGLRGIGPEDIKVFVKIIGYEADPTDEFKNIRTCILQKNEVEYVIISDCINYYIYVYDFQNNSLVEIERFNLCYFEEINFCTLDKMKKAIIEQPKQEYAFNEDDTDEEEVDYEGPSREHRLSTLSEPSEEEYVPKHIVDNKKSDKNKKIMNFIILGSLIVIIIILCIALFGGKESFVNIFNPGNQLFVDRYDIDSDLVLNANGNSGNLDINFSSRDIPSGAKIKFVIQNGNRSSVFYKELGNNGNISTKVAIPTDWDRPEIVVIAYLRFDEMDNVQPTSVTDKFGVAGDKIIQKENAPDRFALSFATIKWDSDAVRAYLEWEQDQKLIAEREQRRKDFGEVDVRYDSKGNIKVIPKGFDMDQNNITESRNVYPQIFYDASEDAAYFYFICGYVGQKWSMFKNVTFYADGYGWNYEISSNEKKQTVNGGYVTEWVYFHNFNIPTLINDVDLLAKSKSSTVRFSGYSIKEHALSNSEKEMIANMLILWDKYFNNLEVKPTTDWFIELDSTSSESGNYSSDNGNVVLGNESSKKGNYSLSYLYVPDLVKERNKSEEIEINELTKKIQDARMNGKSVSEADENAFKEKKNKYREIPNEFKSKLFDYMKTYGGNLTYYQDYENAEMDYYKLYFDYDDKGSVEMGYIPYLYVMENKKVYLPIQDDANSLNNKSYVSFELSNDLYIELEELVENAEYK